MKITKQTNPQAALIELAARLTRYRVESGLTQAQLAKEAGVCKRTIERIENGGDIQVTTLFRVMRILGLSNQLDQLIPEYSPSPVEILKSKAKQPKRAKSRKTADQPWKWGDEK